MHSDLRNHYAARIRYLVALLRAIDNVGAVVTILSSAASQHDALDQLGARLGLSADDCRPILDMRLGQLLPTDTARLREEISDLRAHLGES